MAHRPPNVSGFIWTIYFETTGCEYARLGGLEEQEDGRKIWGNPSNRTPPSHDILLVPGYLFIDWFAIPQCPWLQIEAARAWSKVGLFAKARDWQMDRPSYACPWPALSKPVASLQCCISNNIGGFNGSFPICYFVPLPLYCYTVVYCCTATATAVPHPTFPPPHPPRPPPTASAT